MRLGINRAQSPEKRSVGETDGHRDIALQTIGLRSVVASVKRVLGHMVDYHRLPALPDLMANRGLDLEFAAWLQPKVNVVAHAASNPSILGDACDGGKPHARRATHDVEDRRNRLDAADRGNVLLERFAHAHGVRSSD